MTEQKRPPTPSVQQYKIRLLAESNGCAPIWADGIVGWAYHCGCDENTHGMDQQCSAVNEQSAERRRTT